MKRRCTLFHLFFISISIVLLFNSVFSQSQSRDVIYLKNGSIIKGEIIEQIPNNLIKVQTADGSIIS
jgi:hypothetical protein